MNLPIAGDAGAGAVHGARRGGAAQSKSAKTPTAIASISAVSAPIGRTKRTSRSAPEDANLQLRVKSTTPEYLHATLTETSGGSAYRRHGSCTSKSNRTRLQDSCRGRGGYLSRNRLRSSAGHSHTGCRKCDCAIAHLCERPRLRMRGRVSREDGSNVWAYAQDKSVR